MILAKGARAMSYSQLTREERYVIYTLNKREGVTQTEIADEIGVHKSTVSRELNRNEGQRGYRYKQAHRFALKRRTGHAKRRITDEDWHEIERLLKQDWSPEQVSGRIECEDNGSVSHEWIYQHVWSDKDAGGNLWEHLRCDHRYKTKYGSEDRRGHLSNRTSIDERPDIVDEKDRVGDWEADTVIGKNHQGALLTMVERSTKYAFIGHLKRKTAEGVKEEQVKQLVPHQDRVLTITTDNGREFARHEDVEEQLEADIYFAHPYSSWERGLSENTNGLIRQYFPKDRTLKDVEPEEIEEAVEKLNHRPRKSLNYRTPHEAFHETTNQLTVALTS
jgi:IS30 family transposase